MMEFSVIILKFIVLIYSFHFGDIAAHHPSTPTTMTLESRPDNGHGLPNNEAMDFRANHLS